jgi:hypothetical protein
VVPAWSSVYWWGGVPYYYYDDAYYTWDNTDNGYVATAPPPAIGDTAASDTPINSGAPFDQAAADADAADAAGADAPTQGPPPDSGAAGSAPQSSASVPPPSSGNLYAYPKNGQSDAQQSRDQQACQRWAAAHAASNDSSAPADGSIDYRRALAACLTGRGYSVD